MRRFVLLTSVLVSAFSASACSDGLVSPEPGSLVQASAPATAAPSLVIVPTTVDNIADAVALVRPGGTIRVLRGRYETEGIQIHKSLTIEGSGMPTIDFQNADNHGFEISGNAQDVTIRGLRLINAPVNAIDIFSSTGSHFLIEDNEIQPVHRDPENSGNGVFVSTGEAAVEIRGNHFVGGRQGVTVEQTSNGIIENNTFDGQSFQAFELVNSGGRAEGNTVSACAILCFSVRLDPDITGRVEILGNRFEIGIAAPMDAQAFDGGAGGLGQLVLRGNDFLGTGGERDPNDSNTWPIPGAAFLTNNWESVEIVGNRVEGAFTGITLETADSRTKSLVATDNVFVGVGTAIDAFGGGDFTEVVEIHSNDFTQFTHAIFGGQVSFSDAAITCNWWGSASGPPASAVSEGIAAAVYTPWATTPVAGTTTTSCTGGPRVDPTTQDDCKNGGWEQFGFRNQGECVEFIETGKDRR